MRITHLLWLAILLIFGACTKKQSANLDGIWIPISNNSYPDSLPVFEIQDSNVVAICYQHEFTRVYSNDSFFRDFMELQYVQLNKSSKGITLRFIPNRNYNNAIFRNGDIQLQPQGIDTISVFIPVYGERPFLYYRYNSPNFGNFKYLDPIRIYDLFKMTQQKMKLDTLSKMRNDATSPDKYFWLENNQLWVQNSYKDHRLFNKTVWETADTSANMIYQIYFSSFSNFSTFQLNTKTKDFIYFAGGGIDVFALHQNIFFSLQPNKYAHIFLSNKHSYPIFDIEQGGFVRDKSYLTLFKDAIFHKLPSIDNKKIGRLIPHREDELMIDILGEGQLLHIKKVKALKPCKRNIDNGFLKGSHLFYAFFYQGYTYYFCPTVQDHVLPPRRIKGNHCDKKWTYHDLFNFYGDKSKPILENCKVRASPKEDYFILNDFNAPAILVPRDSVKICDCPD